jgi:alkanesulfonate monooxygenase SsuD/methylene tetrahydromethanopterin reductase-like flavin-dependent oxidoreductase (luciferase family)
VSSARPTRYGTPRNIRFTPQQDKWLREYAKKHGRSFNDVVRIAVSAFFFPRDSIK